MGEISSCRRVNGGIDSMQTNFKYFEITGVGGIDYINSITINLWEINTLRDISGHSFYFSQKRKALFKFPCILLSREENSEENVRNQTFSRIYSPLVIFPRGDIRPLMLTIWLQ